MLPTASAKCAMQGTVLLPLPHTEEKSKEAEQSCACGTISQGSTGTSSTRQCLQCTMSFGTQPHHISPGHTKPRCTSSTEMSVGSGATCSAWQHSAPALRPIIFLTSRRGWCWLEMERGTSWLFSSQEVMFLCTFTPKTVIHLTRNTSFIPLSESPARIRGCVLLLQGADAATGSAEQP